MATRQKKGSIPSLYAESTHNFNVISPKGISKKTPSASVNSKDPTIGLQRRRLSVVSDNKLVEGLAQVSTAETECIENGNGLITSFAGVSKKGYAPYNPRKKNQDTMVLQFDSDSKTLLFCVFDGHGEVGEFVSQALRDKFPAELCKHSKYLSKDLKALQSAISDSLQIVERNILRDSNIDTEFSGTTASIGLLRDNVLIVANVGDSRIVRGYTEIELTFGSQDISIDHKPDLPEEKTRILKSGGRVFAVEYDDGVDGPPRVWLGHLDVPGLAMSRSIGDAVAHTAGVISDPEFFTHTLSASDRCFVMATDGLWEFMNTKEVIEMTVNEESPKAAVDVLLAEANRRWMKEEQVIDDTTVIVVFMDPKAPTGGNALSCKASN
uniref:Protein phosphatase 2C putative n=1 Tax=Albugo laibachii Nc14 TaxID=890382 RepID=F0WL34_9STRA|nr:protein phosphatase 2C putative [Albugo laibachii Nc14]|eukprot:CCA21994.1 protein phosphatase 2C putative [Albugo laibachii Nc14]